MKIREVFGVDRVLLPVIHTVDRSMALESIRIAHAAGCHGVFVIDQELSAVDVFAIVCEARAAHPDLWIGVNILSRRPHQALGDALDACGRIDGIWSDNAGIDLHVADDPPAAEMFRTVRTVRAWTGLHFGGVAFKYQRPVEREDLGRLTALAAKYVDVICTSGPATGIPADIVKVCVMRASTEAPIALASGITAGNVRNYLPYVDAYLVGTGIEERFGVLDPRKVEALNRVITEHVVALEESP